MAKGILQLAGQMAEVISNVQQGMSNFQVVLMDKIYLLSYVLISLILAQIIRAGNKMAKGGGGVKILVRRQHRLAAIYLPVFILGVIGLSLWQ